MLLSYVRSAGRIGVEAAYHKIKLHEPWHDRRRRIVGLKCAHPVRSNFMFHCHPKAEVHCTIVLRTGKLISLLGKSFIS